MTRDEAVKAIRLSDRHYDTWEEMWIDRLVALGILKLDEPKSATEKFKDALIDQGWSPQGVDDAIRQAGVKIVEK